MHIMEQETKEKVKQSVRRNKLKWQLFFLHGNISLNEIMSMDKALLREFAEAHNLYSNECRTKVDVDYNTLFDFLAKAFGKR